MKVCRICKRRRRLSSFGVGTKNADGHATRCKDCTSVWLSMYRQRNAEKLRAYEAARSGTPERVKIQRQSARAYAERYPEKAKARRAVTNAVRDGRLIRRPCEKCGMRAQAHHDDYRKRLDVRWLCAAHHYEEHRNIRLATKYALSREAHA